MVIGLVAETDLGFVALVILVAGVFALVCAVLGVLAAHGWNKFYAKVRQPDWAKEGGIKR